MSRIMFCATPDGMRRQVSALTTTYGDVPLTLQGERGVLDAILALEMGANVVADARTTLTGWRIPEGVQVGFDPDMGGAENAALGARCLSRAIRIAPDPGLLRVALPRDAGARPLSDLKVRVVDPFGPHEPAQAALDAA